MEPEFTFHKIKRQFFWHFHKLPGYCWSLGVHFDYRYPVLDFHMPMGFLRVGWNMFPSMREVEIGIQAHQSLKDQSHALYDDSFV